MCSLAGCHIFASLFGKGCRRMHSSCRPKEGRGTSSGWFQYCPYKARGQSQRVSDLPWRLCTIRECHLTCTHRHPLTTPSVPSQYRLSDISVPSQCLLSSISLPSHCHLSAIPIPSHHHPITLSVSPQYPHSTIFSSTLSTISPSMPCLF